MTGRQRERIKSLAVCVLVLAYFAVFAGWAWTLGFVALCAVTWYIGHQRPLARMVKQAKRKG